MISPYLKYRKVFKITVLSLLLFIIFGAAFSVISLRKSEGSVSGRLAPIVIGNIHADKKQNLLNITCSFSEKINTDTTMLSELIMVNIGKKDTLFTDVYIKTIDSLSENTVILGVQPPLKDALYGIEKRDITVLNTEDSTVVASKTAILGTAMQRLDLRAYTVSRPLAAILKGTLFFLGVSTVFMLILPAIRKYNFKKYNIKKYKHITAEDKATLDPFTFETIEEKDEVVIIDEHIILLRSWKRLYALKTEDRPGGFDMFFNEEEKNTLFKPLTETGRKINGVWFGALGAYTAWLFYTVFMQFDMPAYGSLLFGVFDNASKQFSNLVYADSILAACLGVASGIVFLVMKKLYGQGRIPLLKTISRLVLKIVAFQFLFLFSFLVNAYLINNTIFGTFITWLCAGMGLAIIAGMRSKLKKSLIAAGITGAAGFIAWQLCSLHIFLDVLNTEMMLLISLLFAGGTLGGLTYTKFSIAQEPLQDKDADVIGHIEVSAAQNNKPALKKVV